MKIKFLTLFLALGAFAAQAAVIFSVDPVNQSVALGNQAIVQVRGSGLSLNQVIGAYDVTLQWNSGLVSLASSSFGPALGTNTIESSVAGGNSINMASVSLDASAILAPLQSPEPFLLFTLTFNTLAAGITPVEFLPQGTFIIADGDGTPISGASGANGSIEITGGGGSSVPEPSTIVLMSAGLVALVVKSRRRQ